MDARRIDSANGYSLVSARQGLGFMALLVGRGTAELSARVALRGVFLGVLVTALALEAIRFGYVERPVPLSVAYQDNDPVVAQVGNELIRMSDAYAQALLIGEEVSLEGDLTGLIATGTIDAAADQAALAQAARQAGIDGNLQIRAALALAERQILAEAYLSKIAAAAANEEAIAARYAEETSALAADSVLRLSEIVVADRAEAEALHARLTPANFAKLAKQHSIAASRTESGAAGELRLGALPGDVAAVAGELAIGRISEPFQSSDGWHILKLEARRALRLPPLEERRDAIAADLRREAIAEALDGAKAIAPVRLRPAEAVVAELPSGLPASSIASARKF
jgi:peptidyl-prolyl cis-trans isomerase C